MIPVQLDWYDALRLEQSEEHRSVDSRRDRSAIAGGLQRLMTELPDELVIVAADVVSQANQLL